MDIGSEGMVGEVGNGEDCIEGTNESGQIDKHFVRVDAAKDTKDQNDH
jgi:hypothetical protein